MGRFPMVDAGRQGADALEACPRPLPDFYMEDFTVLGLLVSPWEAAARILSENGFEVLRTDGGAEVVVDSPDRLEDAVRALARNGVRCEVSDVAEQIYQG